MLNAVEYKDAVVAPLRRTAKQKREFHCGAFTKTLEPIEPSLFWRNGRQLGVPYPVVGPVVEDDRRVIYGGRLFNHFGHFLLEGLARLWVARDQPDLPIVWSTWERLGTSVYRGWQQGILSAIGLEREAIFLTQPTRFSSVVVPEPGYVTPTVFDRDYARFIGCYSNPDPAKRAPLWLSRSRLEDAGGDLLAPRLEARLADEGWTILHPQEMPVAAQLDYLSNATRVAGELGSAFHLLVLLKETQGLKVDIFCRDPALPAEKHNQNYENVARTLQLDQALHVDASEYVLKRTVAAITKVSKNLDAKLDILGVPVTEESPMEKAARARPQVRRTAHLVNELAKLTDAKTYLEIGVSSGKTLFNVGVQDRYAVDPRFRFDTRDHADSGIQFFEMESNLFFQSHLRNCPLFDIVFIDGLHTFEQSFRDFCAVQSRIHPKTVIIIDDTVPSDVYSAMPKFNMAMRYRAEAGLDEKTWHGDVFKTMFAIHDYFPNFDFVTVLDIGNPQCVLLNAPRAEFTPIFPSLEKISRLTYFDFLDRRDVFNFRSEEETIAWVQETLAAL